MLKDLYHYFLIARSGYFDPKYYLITYPDIRRADLDPLWHFVRCGWKEGRNPSDSFDTNYYLISNHDVKNENINPLIHYIKFGKSENRKTAPQNMYDMFLNLGDESELINIESIPPIDSANGEIAVHLHIYYEDLSSEFVELLKNMPFDYDLFISVGNKMTYEKCLEVFKNLPFLKNLDVKIVPNRGRDIAPFICTFGESIQKYDFVAHLHSKKSIYNKGATEGWRDYLCHSLLGSKYRIKKILSLLQETNQFGIIYPQTYHRVPYTAHTWLANRRLATLWGTRLGINHLPSGFFDFPVGTMFWAKVDALKPLFDAGITINDFQEETGQSDGTLSHALERLIGLLIQQNSKKHGIIRDVDNPSWSSWRIDQYFNKSYEGFKNIIHSKTIKVIGFDLFDTLITRPLLDPESIKKIVSLRIGEQAGELYKKFRQLAEIQARQKKGSDVNIDEIYIELGALTALNQEQLEKIKTVEIEIEICILQPREESLELFNDAIKSGKKIAIISDTFLPLSIIQKILKNNNVDGWNDLFLSNQIGLRKDTGEIFKFILNHYSIQPEEMLMIGDNERSDNQLPQNMGLKTLHLLKPIEIARCLPRLRDIIKDAEYNGSIDSELSLGLIINKNFSPITYKDLSPNCLVKVTPYNIGYSIVGPLLVSLSQWLITSSQQDKIEHFFFLSREGKIIKQVFDEWCTNLKGHPKSSYLELSRRATTVPLIDSIDDIFRISQIEYFPNTLSEFLYTRFGLRTGEIRWDELKKHTNFEPNDTISVHEQNIDHLKKLLRFLEPEIKNKSKIERLALLHYLSRKGLQTSENKAVVDVGYGGTVQSQLNKLFSEKIHGYYLLTDLRAKQVSKDFDVLIRGCFGEEIDPHNNQSIMFRYQFKLEKLLSSNDPQLEYFKLADNNHFSGIYRELSESETKSFNIRQQMQNGAMDYTRNAVWLRDEILPDFQPSINTAKSIIEAFLTYQCEDEDLLFNGIKLDDYYCGRDLV